jgi:DNA helicase HerA-like ATPase
MFIDTQEILSFLTSEDFIGQSVAVLGIKGSGKSNTAAVLMEELLTAGVPILVVDIAGEYYTLRDKFEQVTVVGRSIDAEVQVVITQNNVHKVAATAYGNGRSVVLDVSGVPSEARDDILWEYFGEVWRQSARLRIPLVIFLEEAHNWMPQVGRSPLKDTLINIATEGRKRGLSLVQIGQRSTRIAKDTLTQADVAFLHKVRHPTDMRVYMELIPRPPRWVKERINSLKSGEAVVLVRDKVLRCQMRLRHTSHPGSTPTMANIPAQQLSLLELLDTI